MIRNRISIRISARELFSDLLILGGVAGIGYALWTVDARLSWSFVGVCALAYGWLLGRGPSVG